MAAVLSVFPLHHLHHTRPLILTVNIRRRLSLLYAAAGDIGDTAYLEAAHLDYRTQPYCCGASDLFPLLLNVRRRNLWSPCHWEPLILVTLIFGSCLDAERIDMRHW
jgi:hypothetical protein